MATLTKYTAHDLINFKRSKQWMIKNFIHYGDKVVLKGKSGTGKSSFVQYVAQIASCGELMFKSYPTTRPNIVAYLYGESDEAEWKDRLINMKKLHNMEDANIDFIHCDLLSLEQDNDRELLLKSLQQYREHYDLIIYDCLYVLLNGSVNSDDIIRAFNRNEGHIRSSMPGCASIIIHHDTEKTYKDKNGKKHSGASPTTCFGSSFITAHTTHMFTLEKHNDNKGEHLKLVRGKKRSGDIMTEVIFRMITPEDDEKERLGFVIDENEVNDNYRLISEFMQGKGEVSVRGLYKKILNETTFRASYETLRRINLRLIKNKLVRKKRNGENIEKFTWIGTKL